MKRAVCISALSSLCLLPCLAQAQIIICKDASGRTITADRPVPECADRAQRIMDKSGVVRREIPAPLTPDQKREMRAEEERAKIKAAADEKEKQNDLAMMARYPYERDIETARNRSLEPIKDQIKRELVLLAAAEKELAKAQAEADRLKGRKVPAPLQQRIDENQKNIKDSLALLQMRETDITDTNARFDAVLKRYRELSKTTAAAPAR